MYADIDPQDQADVDYFNSYDNIKSVPEEERAECLELSVKYMSKGMEEEAPGWSEMADSAKEKTSEHG